LGELEWVKGCEEGVKGVCVSVMCEDIEYTLALSKDIFAVWKAKSLLALLRGNV